jgi:hypothetical protein
MTGRKRGLLAYQAARAEWELRQGRRGDMSEVAKIVPQESAPLPTVQRSAMTPMEMLSMAVSNGAGIDVLERLMALQERWQNGQARRAFDEAIAAAKAKIKPIIKNRKVDFTSQKGRTNYEHEDLAEIARQVDPILAEHGLSYRYRSAQDGRQLTITCIISHRDGYSEENSLNAGNDESGNKNAIQAIGSTATYLQRYTLKLALGLAAAKDDDARAAIAAPPTITEAQLAELIALADATGSDKGRFCKHFGIEGIAQLPTAKFREARALLETKLRQAAKAKAAPKPEVADAGH